MKTKTPTLESLGLKCSIVSTGIRPMHENETPMLAWNALFTNASGRSDDFDYFTGTGCGPQLSESRLRQHFPLVANVPRHNRHLIKDKWLLANVALFAARSAKWAPDPIEILWAVANDGGALKCTFEDWANECGYDSDSRKAEKIYRACKDNAVRLKKILGREQIEMIQGLEL